MAFKGKTTAGYNSKTGKGRVPAKTAGKVAPNPRQPLPTAKASVVTKQTKTGMNPRNTKSQTQNSNRVQKAVGGKKMGGQTGIHGIANVAAAAARNLNPLNKAPFSGYKLNRNSKNVPAGKGNIRNAGSVQRGDVARLRKSTRLAMPPKAISGGNKGGFKGFINGN